MKRKNHNRRLKKSGITTYRLRRGGDSLTSLKDRINFMLRITQNKEEEFRMTYFVMYDIRSNKVRKLISDFLIKKGCFRVQRSIFLGKTKTEVYQQIKNTLAQIQESYENNDSIFIVPITNDLLRSVKIIGKDVDINLITKNNTTLFF